MAEMYRWADLGNPFGKMSGTSAIFIVALIGVGLYFWIFRPKRR
jgi:preprotein translocase subunit YajC